MRAGEVFVECAEKTGFPGFWFLWQAKTASWGDEHSSPEGKKANPEDRMKAIGCILAPCWAPKWKSVRRDKPARGRECKSLTRKG